MKKKTESDIIKLILKDHKPLKALIKVLKDSKKDTSKKESAFKEFAPLLLAHAKAEQESLYVDLKKDTKLRGDGYEGEIEHLIAEQLVREIKGTKDKNVWGAKTKVLAELVEHHIEEEEDEMLPSFKKRSSIEDRKVIGELYLQLKDEGEEAGNGLDKAMPPGRLEKKQEKDSVSFKS